MKTIKNVMKKGLFALMLAVAVLSIGMAVSAQTVQAKARNAPKGANKKDVEALRKMIDEFSKYGQGVAQDMSSRIYKWENGRLVHIQIVASLKKNKKLPKGGLVLDCSPLRNLKSMDVSIPDSIKIDVSKNKKIEKMRVHSKNQIKFSKQNSKLKTLLVEQGQMDISKLSGLKDLTMVFWELSSFDFSKNKKLEKLKVNGRYPQTNKGLKRIKLPRSVKDLEINNVPATEFDFSGCTGLVTLTVNACPKLTKIKLPDSTSLKHFFCSFNKLTGCLDLSRFINLESVRCIHNALTSLILPDTNTLRYLACESNKITDMDSINPEKLREKYPQLVGVTTDFVKPNETPAPTN